MLNFDEYFFDIFLLVELMLLSEIQTSNLNFDLFFFDIYILNLNSYPKALDDYMLVYNR